MAQGLRESLVSDSTIYLFGRPIDDLQLARDPEIYNTGPDAPPLARRSPNHCVVDQLLSKDARIARIYAFSFQNEFFELARPALFVVNGDGDDPLRDEKDPGGVWERRQYGYPLGLTGLSQSGGGLATELRVWAYDRDDFSVRLDIMTGPFGRILLDYELAEDGLQNFVRGGGQLGQPSPLGTRGRGRRGRWRSDDD